nr:MAG TPA: Protein of unknown function (DUF1642) [Caudoviricetes sp.]
MNKQELIKYFDELPYVSITQMGKKSFVDLIEQLDEPEKVKIPSVVAQWIGYAKGWNKGLHYALSNASDEVLEWLCVDKLKRQGIFARAWLDGYEIEEEKRYIVKIKNLDSDVRVLKKKNRWYFGGDWDDARDAELKIHTRKELEEAGFGWVFDCPGIKIEEVE